MSDKVEQLQLIIDEEVVARATAEAKLAKAVEFIECHIIHSDDGDYGFILWRAKQLLEEIA